MKNKDKTRKINEFNNKTMVSHIGIEIMEAGKDFVSGRMPVDKRTTQPYGLLHGGASVAFAESLGRASARERCLAASHLSLCSPNRKYRLHQQSD